jgi:hypothetical protein
MKNNYLVLALLSIVIISCSKGQRTANKMEGKWNVVSADLVGLGEIDPDLIFEFDFCKVHKNELCEFTLHDFDTDYLYYGSYSLSENGNNLILSSGFGLGMNFEVYEIEKLNSRRLILTDDDALYGSYRRIELKYVR